MITMRQNPIVDGLPRPDFVQDQNPSHWRAATWERFAVVGTTLLVLLFTAIHLCQWDRNWQSENVLLILGVCVVSAWFCPPRFVLTLTVFTYVAWCAFDCQNAADGWICLVRSALRIGLTAILVALT